MTCDVCHVDKTVTLEHEVTIGKRVVRWRTCRECESWQLEEGDKRAARAVKVAERAGV